MLGNKPKIDPDYETIPAATTSAPAVNAPPKLPPRNYAKRTDDEFAETSGNDSPEVSKMTRGER